MIIVSPQAEANLLDILQNYELQNPEVAARFDAEYKKIRGLIDRLPRMYRVFHRPNYRCAHMMRFPYSVIYREVSPTVRKIVAIVHKRRRPGYWMEGRVMEEAAVYLTPTVADWVAETPAPAWAGP